MINFDYNIYSLVKDSPYMHNGTKLDMVKYVDDFSSDNENFNYNDKIKVNKITNLDNGICILNTNFEIELKNINIKTNVPRDSISYTPYTRNCERGMIISNTLANEIFNSLPKIKIYENDSYYESICCSSFIRMISYNNIGQQFISHRDGYFIKKSNNDVRTFYTFIIYLNDVNDGGETEFPFLNIKIKPQKGNILIFPHSEVHRGLEIISQSKKILRGDIYFKKTI